MKRYNPTEIEQKWQAKWEQDGTYAVDLSDQSRPKYLGFSMLPGITGAGIHIGHGRTFQFSDIKVRAKRQQGYNAFHPIGWDSFGLPVENYAIKIGKKPREAHDEAKKNFIRQLKRLGYSYDWTKQISTADPQYYKWTQWIFTQLYKNDLAYQKEQPQWWCEHDQTVLANEQVEGGKCWRCGNQVVKKNLKQWFFKITEYADEILEATDELDWTEMVKTMQKNWIGKSQGAEIEFALEGHDQVVTVFSTRPDTLFGATFLVLAPEHELVKQLATDETRGTVEAYVAEAARKSEVERMNETREKSGVFSGAYAINPANGEKIPVWIADYVLAGYGTGAIMAVPAHDERDFAFAEKFGLPVVQVIASFAEFTGDQAPHPDVETTERETVDAIIRDQEGNYLLQIEGPQSHFVGGGVDPEDETIVEALRREVREETGYIDIESIVPIAPIATGIAYRHTKNINQKGVGHFFEVTLASLDQVRNESDEGKHELKWVAKELVRDQIDWSWQRDAWDHYVSKKPAQFYVGEGVLVNSAAFDGMPTSDAREEVVAWLEEQGTGKSKVTYKMRDWLISRQRYWGAPIPIIHCPDHGAVAVPDDQLPVVLPDVDDYTPKGGATSVLAGVDEWVNTLCPECGKPAKRETDTLDGYACSSWYFLRYTDPFNTDEAWSPKGADYWQPVDFYNGGDHAVAHLLYSRFWMRFFYKQGLVPTPEPFKRMMYNGFILAPDGQKMSKSKGNVIDPLEIMDSGYGADSLRVYEMFIAPYDLDAPWDTRGVPGTYRFLNRVWTLVQEYLLANEATLDDKVARDVLVIAHKTIKKVTSDIEDDKFNTAVSSMMEAVNGLYKIKESNGITQSSEWKVALEGILQVLAPFAPHITEELWQDLGHSDTIHKDHWPQWDDAYLVSDTMRIIVQVNGKLRAKFDLPVGTSEQDVKAQALAAENVAKFIDGEPKKVIYIPGKLVNIVA